MARSVDEIEDILLTFIIVHHLDRVALDGDALFPLQIHGIQHLILHLPLRKGVGVLQQTVRQRTLSMVYMGYYAKVTDIFHLNGKIRCKDTLFSQFLKFILS